MDVQERRSRFPPRQWFIAGSSCALRTSSVFVNRTTVEIAELEAEAQRVCTEHADLPEVELACHCAPSRKSIAELRRSYGADPGTGSHAEQFLNFVADPGT